MQDFAVEVIYYMTESGSTRLKRGDLQVGRTRMQGWLYKKNRGNPRRYSISDEHRPEILVTNESVTTSRVPLPT